MARLTKIVAVVGLVLLAACGSDDDDGDGGASSDDGTIRRADVLDLTAACRIAASALADPDRRQLYLSDTELVACPT